MSTLLQTPALYTAASFASSFVPPGSVGQVNSPPNLAAMAAATVAAASAWWAANGLLPLCSPFIPGYPPTAFAPSGHVDNTKAGTLQEKNRERMDLEYSEALKARSSLDTEEFVNASKSDGQEQPSAAAETDGARERKQVDRSSCGSNTSSDDVEAGDASERQENEGKEVNANDPQTTETNARRSSRITSNVTDPWKAVSDEGKIAFRALFSREVLPQSFAYQEHQEEEKQGQEHRYPMGIDLNCTAQIGPNDEERLKIGLGGSKVSRERIGFKPYKRCSMEAKESIHVEQKDPKRTRLETQSST